MSADAWANAGAVPAGAGESAPTADQGASSDPWMIAGAVPASAGRMPIQAQTPDTPAPAGTAPASQAPPPPAAQAVVTGAGKGVRAAMEGAGDVADFAPDVVKGLINLPGDVNKMAGGQGFGAPLPYHVVRTAAATLADQLGLPKDQNTLDRLGSAIVEGVTASLGVGGALSALKGAGGVAGAVGEASASPAANIVTGATGATAGQLTAEAGGGPVAQTVASLLGGAAGGLALHGATPQVETTPAVPRAQGPVARAVAPYAAAVLPGAAERAAGARIAGAATDPAAVQASLAQSGELIPGSQPTAFQQTGDAGLGGLERDVATRNQPAFQERAAQQNAARVQALGDIQRGADPNDVAATLRQQFQDLDTAHEDAVDQATQAAQAKAAAFGGTLPADQYGQVIRDAMHTGERGAAAHVSSFYDAIDPHGDLTGNLQATRQGAQQIADSVGPTAMPMSAPEADVFAKAADLPDLAPAKQLIDLRQYLNAVARDPAVAGTPTSARLTQLRGIIDDNLANTISQQIANEAPAVAAGALDASQSMAAKVQSWRDNFIANRNAGVATGDVRGASDASLGAPAVPGVRGTEGAPGEGPPSATRPAPVPGTPSFDEAARERLIAANQAAREKAQTWGPAAIKSILAKDSNGNFRVSDGAVGAKYFHPGASGFQHMQEALTASPSSRAALVDYAATTLRRAAMNEDGTVDPTKFQRWNSAYSDALRALPAEARAKFADAASASQTLAQARAARTAALTAAQSGAIGRVMKLTEPEDVTRAIGSILNGRTAAADMKQLALATKGNPDARAGLRQAVANYVAQKLVGNTEAGTSGVSQIKGDAYQTFVKNARPALNLIFSPEEVHAMAAVAEDIQRSNRSLNSKPAGTPGTAHDVLAGLKRAAGHGSKSMLDIVGGVIGHHLGGEAGLAAGIGAAELVKGLESKGISRIDQLVAQSMLDPPLMAELLKKAPTTGAPMSFKPLTIALLRSGAATGVSPRH